VAALPVVLAHVVVGLPVVPVRVAVALHVAQLLAAAQHVVAEPAAVARAVAPRAVVLHVAVEPAAAVRHVVLTQFFVAAWHVLQPQGVLLFAPAQSVGCAQVVPHLAYRHVHGCLVSQQPALHLSCRPGGLQLLPPVFHGLLWQTMTCRCVQLADAKSG